MSFRQFPATGDDGNAYVIIEFRDGQQADSATGEHTPRYELADGQRLQRYENRYANADGTLVLTAD